MSGAPVRERQDSLHAFADEIVRSIEHRRIEIPLYALVFADSGPPFVERHPPVEPDDVTAGLADVPEQLAGADPEVDRRAVEVAQRLDPHAGATGQGALCDPPLADRLADLRNRIAQVERVADAARAAFRQAWGNDAIDAGVGGSIPFIAAFASAFPDAKILVTGVEDPDTQAHSINESLHLGVLERAATAEALLLDRLARSDRQIAT